MTDASDVSVVIVSWNSRVWLRRCLQPLHREGCEVVVVDNASTDGSADLVATEFPSTVLVRESRNRGFAAGCNRGWRASGRRLILLLNPDVEAPAGAVGRLAAFLATHPEHAAAGGRLVDEAGAFQRGFGVRRFPTVASIAADALLVDELWPANPISRRYLALDLDDSVTQDVDQPAGACLMVRRDTLEALGGLDEAFHPAWFEDVDLCRRLWDRNLRIAFVADATFTHAGGGAAARLGLDRFSRAYYRNLRRYVRKHLSAGASALASTAIVVGMLERCVAAALIGRLGRAGAYARVAADTLMHPIRSDE